jgi:hypothetical protein
LPNEFTIFTDTAEFAASFMAHPGITTLLEKLIPDSPKGRRLPMLESLILTDQPAVLPEK